MHADYPKSDLAQRLDSLLLYLCGTIAGGTITEAMNADRIEPNQAVILACAALAPIIASLFTGSHPGRHRADT